MEPWEVDEDMVEREEPWSRLSTVLGAVDAVLPLSIRAAFPEPPNSSMSRPRSMGGCGGDD
jgi:hypothetical protein